MHQPPIHLLSFCSGAGGLDRGLLNALPTAKHAMLCESNKDARRTLECNFPDVPIYSDLCTLNAEQLREDLHLTDTDVLLCAGGVPCPSFSTAGKRKGLDDVRGQCLPVFVDLCIALSAKYILLENVRGLLSAKRSPDDAVGSVLRLFVQRLENHGYLVTYQLCDAKYFGACQSRDRLVLMAVKANAPIPFLTPTHGTQHVSFRTLADALHALPTDVCTDGSTYAAKKRDVFAQLAAGEHWRHLQDRLTPDALVAAVGKGTLAAGGGKTGVYRRLAWDKPCPTLTCAPTQHTTGFCHPSHVRPLTCAEYAAVQGFAHDYTVCGSVAARYRQIGNAVPVPFAEAMGRALYAYHHDGKREPPRFVRCSRYTVGGYVTSSKPPPEHHAAASSV